MRLTWASQVAYEPAKSPIRRLGGNGPTPDSLLPGRRPAGRTVQLVAAGWRGFPPDPYEPGRAFVGVVLPQRVAFEARQIRRQGEAAVRRVHRGAGLSKPS